MKHLKYILLVLFMACYGCREPFDFQYEEVEAPVVVIDGFITDNGRRHAVRVSYSTFVNDNNIVETNFVSDATVRIEDDQGSGTLLSYSGGGGLYFSQPQYAAQEGRSYTLIVTLANGEQYRSEAKSMPAASPATARLSFEGDTRNALSSNDRVEAIEGAVIKATIDKDNDRHFYQWLIGHYYIYTADLAPEALSQCYVRDFDESAIYLLQDNPAVTGSEAAYTYEIDFVPISAQMRVDFGVEGRLLTLNEEDYNFWDKVDRLASNSGGLFDAAPFSIEGNISNAATGAKALGYFGVYRESIDRLFFYLPELGFGQRSFNACTLPPMAVLPHPCTDCRQFAAQENLGVVPPVWWRN